jgi:hypothetical protein
VGKLFQVRCKKLDQITQEVRLESWAKIVRSCSARPSGVTQKEWLEENGITRVQYYYWQRKVRQAAYLEQKTGASSMIAAPSDAAALPVTFAELPQEQIQSTEPEPKESSFHADAVIHIEGNAVEISNTISPALLRVILKEARDAR